MNTIDAAHYRTVMSKFATGVTVVTWLIDGQPAGMTANAFMSVSMDPPLILVSVRNTSRFTQQIKVGDGFGVNFLTADQEDVSNHFGGKPKTGVAFKFQENSGQPLIEDGLAHVVCSVVNIHEAGDHLLYIAEIKHMACGQESDPLIFYRGKYKQIRAHQPCVN